eukprot:243212-Pelagomonas_calceolata.AAC.3
MPHASIQLQTQGPSSPHICTVQVNIWDWTVMLAVTLSRAYCGQQGLTALRALHGPALSAAGAGLTDSTPVMQSAV